MITSDWSAAALREGDGGDHAAEAHPPPAPRIRGVRGRGQPLQVILKRVL